MRAVLTAGSLVASQISGKRLLAAIQPTVPHRRTRGKVRSLSARWPKQMPLVSESVGM